MHRNPPGAPRSPKTPYAQPQTPRPQAGCGLRHPRPPASTRARRPGGHGRVAGVHVRRSCGQRVQPRHPEQTSDALGAAGAQLGPRAVALAAWLSKGLGVPAGRIARLLGHLGLDATPGGVTQTVTRAARRCRELLADAGRDPPRGAPHPRARPGAAGGPRRRDPGCGHARRRGRAPRGQAHAGATRYPPNPRLLDHLGREREQLFTFLHAPGVEATNWRAEQAIRPAVVTRKAWVATAPGPGLPPGRLWPASCAPPASKAATPSTSWPGCCAYPPRSWPTSPSRGADHRRTAPTMTR
jgi:hypothetical protein